MTPTGTRQHVGDFEEQCPALHRAAYQAGFRLLGDRAAAEDVAGAIPAGITVLSTDFHQRLGGRPPRVEPADGLPRAHITA